MRYLILIKYKLALAVTLTCATGFLIAAASVADGTGILAGGSGEILPSATLKVTNSTKTLFPSYISLNFFLTIFGLFMLAGGAAALNQYQERNSDRLMSRTRNRPIPAGMITPQQALAVSAGMIIIGLSLLAAVSITAAFLGILNLLLYNLVYTWLKKLSYLSIIPGALVGAIPPLIGWVATGADISDPLILFLATLIFLWQIPHFWILLIRNSNDYTCAGYHTVFRVFDEAQVLRIVFVWIAVSSVFVMSFPLFGIITGKVISYLIVVLNIAFIALFYFLLFGRHRLRSAFILSNVFITVIFILVAIGSL